MSRNQLLVSRLKKKAEKRRPDETLVALYAALLPIARIMVRGRLSARELIQAAKLAYVDAAISEVIPPGSKINVSTIAVVSGLTRKEIAALLQRSSNKGRAGEKRFVQQRTIRVIHGWKVDPHFQNRSGKPRDLSVSGTQRSFHLLVKRHGGDVTPTSVLRELERMQAVTRTSEGLIRLKSRAMQSTQHATQHILEFSRLLKDFSNTLQQVSAPNEPRGRGSMVGASEENQR